MSGPEPWWRCTTGNRYPWLKPRGPWAQWVEVSQLLGELHRQLLPGFGHEVDLSNSFQRRERTLVAWPQVFRPKAATSSRKIFNVSGLKTAEEVSTNHGFEEIDGPTFEHLSLYTTKSGDGIVSELFSFGDRAGTTITPFGQNDPDRGEVGGRCCPAKTHAFAMVWYRAFLPRRTTTTCRLRVLAVECGRDWRSLHERRVGLLGLLAGTLERFGLRPDDVANRLSHRDAAASVLQGLGVHEDQLHEATLLDRKEKMPPEVFATQAQPLGLGPDEIAKLDAVLSSSASTDALVKTAGLGLQTEGLTPLFDLPPPCVMRA